MEWEWGQVEFGNLLTFFLIFYTKTFSEQQQA